MNELKGITGIDIAVNALVDELQSRKDELVSEISALAGIVTTESNIQERKSDRATVNKRRKEFDDERKNVERTWKNAIAPVSAAYKEAVAECDKVIADIDVGLKDFEEKRREAKKQLIIKCFVHVEVPEGIEGWLGLVDVYDTKWENASYKKAQIIKDITDAYAKVKMAYDTIKMMNHPYENEGLEVLKSTRDLQKAIAKMQSLQEQEEIIKARRTENLIEIKEPEELIKVTTPEPKVPEFNAEELVPDDSDVFVFGIPEETTYRVSFEIKGTKLLAKWENFLKEAELSYKVEVI